MKNTLWLLLIIAGLLLTAQPAAAFDPGAWLKQGISKLDAMAAEDMSRRGNARKQPSTKEHRDTVRRIKKYLKAENKKSFRRR